MHGFRVQAESRRHDPWDVWVREENENSIPIVLEFLMNLLQPHSWSKALPDFVKTWFVCLL